MIRSRATSGTNIADWSAGSGHCFGLALWRKRAISVAFSRQRHKVLLSVDTDKTNLEGTSMKRGVDYPQSWVRDYGKGRVFYTSFGHRDDIWSVDPVFQAHLNGGIRWALGMEK